MRLECGELTARVAAGSLLSVTSLCLSGRELLVDPAELPVHYRIHGSRAGITLMHPWANRVGADAFTVGDRAIELGPGEPGVTRDGNGLAIHGLRAASGWALERRSEGSCVAWLEFAPVPGFPFRHRAEVSLELATPGTLTIDTTIVPDDPGGAPPDDPGGAPAGDPGGVPVAFGWHPYFRVERNPEDELVMPRCSRLSLDERGLPTGEAQPIAEGAAPIGERRFDDLFAEIETGAGFGWRTSDLDLAVIHERGYPFAQVFAPGDAPVLSLEPMTAPTDALRTGRELPVATSATPFTARFSVVVRT